jgi:hypothetical protein
MSCTLYSDVLIDRAQTPGLAAPPEFYFTGLLREGPGRCSALVSSHITYNE